MPYLLFRMRHHVHYVKLLESASYTISSSTLAQIMSCLRLRHYIHIGVGSVLNLIPPCLHCHIHVSASVYFVSKSFLTFPPCCHVRVIVIYRSVSPKLRQNWKRGSTWAKRLLPNPCENSKPDPK